MGNVPAEVSAYLSRIAKNAAQNLSPEARYLRARGAAEARWARVRAQADHAGVTRHWPGDGEGEPAK